MRSKTALKTREKGTGTVYKSRNRFYLKTRINGKTKTQVLPQNQNQRQNENPDAP